MSPRPHHSPMLLSPNYQFLNQAKVPFAWEVKPGVPKHGGGDEWHLELQLPPPPCPSTTARIFIDYYGDPLPKSPPVVCPTARVFHGSAASKISRSRRMSFRKNPEDPFLTAYRNCGQTDRDGPSIMNSNVAENNNNNNKKKKSLWSLVGFSCVYPGSVSCSDSKGA